MARLAMVCCLLALGALLLLVDAGSGGPDRAGGRDAASEPTVFRLPPDTGPGRLAVAGDGAVWMTRDYGGLLRLSPAGAREEFLATGDDYVADLVRGPDGAIWAAADQKVVRVDPSDEVPVRPVGRDEGADAITTAHGSVWVMKSWNADAGDRPTIERVAPDGATRTFTVPKPRAWLGFNGATGGPDGSLWFTHSGDRGGGIGRMTSDGTFSSWPLPRAAGDPGRIVAGSDEAIWFSEDRGIGRITTTGATTHFPLRDGLAAADMVAGADGGVWFASDICVGRLTTAGEVTTWPVPGATQLTGIAAGPDGTFWLADRLGNTIRRFSPSTAPEGPCGAPAFTRRAGSTSATVSYRPTRRFDGVTSFSDIRMQIDRDGSRLLSEAVPGRRGNDAFSDTQSLAVRDLDGDREPEVMLLLNWHGAHCCWWSRVYRYDRARHAYVAGTHFWGNGGAEPELRDLDGDRRPELVSVDDRFAEVFTSIAGSARPLQIWSYRRGELRDVTRRHPTLVRRDARRLWRLYVKHRRNARGILPAWMATQYLLGRAEAADRVLEQARQRGELDRATFGPPDAAAYVRAVKALLRKTGYAP